MSRGLTDCDTYNTYEQDLPEPEEEDFFKEVVENSLRTKRKHHTGKNLKKRH